MPLQRLPILMADTSLPRPRVVRVLEQIRRYSGVPVTIFVNTDPQFTGRALDAWTHDRGVRLHFTEPGKPVEGAFSESFNGKFRYEFLNEHGITTLAHAGEVTEARRMDYNAVRPHSGSENLTPHEHAQQIHASIPTGLFIIGGPDFGDRSERRISRKRPATRSK